MTLDPDVKKLLEVIEMNHPKDLNAISPVDFRSSFRQSALLFSGQKEEVEEVIDMSFRYDDSEIPLRVYRPHNAGEGAIIYYHGGGFVIGDIEAYDSQCRKIANSSMQTVISVGYRLAPEHKFPTWTYDSFEAYRWVFKNSSKLNINGSKIAVSGDSAGGNLSFVVPLMLLDRSLEVPKMIIALYPFIGVDRFSETWREYSRGLFLDREAMSYFAKMTRLNPEDFVNPYYSPAHHPKLSYLPESIVVTAEYDPLREQGETFLSQIREAGTRATGIRALGMIHGFATFSGAVPAADKILRAIYRNAGRDLD